MASVIKNLISKKDEMLYNPLSSKYSAKRKNLEFNFFSKKDKRDRNKNLQNPMSIKNPLINQNKNLKIKQTKNSKVEKTLQNPQLFIQGSIGKAFNAFHNHIEDNHETPFLKIDSNAFKERQLTSVKVYNTSLNNDNDSILPKISIDKQRTPSLENKIQIAQPVDGFIEPLKLGIPIKFQNIENFITQKNDLFSKGPVTNLLCLPIYFDIESSKRSRIVYDSFEKSPYNPQFEHCKEVESIIDKSFNSYSLIAGGKGVPKKSSINKLKMKRKLEPFYLPTNASDNTLIFESRFECGNLRRAIQMLINIEMITNMICL